MTQRSVRHGGYRSRMRRRAWGAMAALLALAVPGLWAGHGTAHAEVQEVRIWYVGPTEGTVWRGVEFGTHDANLVGEFQGFVFELDPIDKERLLEQGPQERLAVVVGTSGDHAAAISEALPEIPVFNIVSDDDELRALCRDNLFSTMPSRAMRDDAVAQFREAQGEADVEAVAHHPEFRRYSSSDLNSRFSSYHDGAKMDEAAWTGFAALKLLGDAYPRLDQRDPEGLIDYLWELRGFDASKGEPMSFRPDGQLLQPLWLVRGDEIKGEAPVDGDLETLGENRCPVE